MSREDDTYRARFLLWERWPRTTPICAVPLANANGKGPGSHGWHTGFARRATGCMCIEKRSNLLSLQHEAPMGLVQGTPAGEVMSSSGDKFPPRSVSGLR